MRAHIILGNQLFKNHPALNFPKNEPIILIESIKSSNKYHYHKLKLVFVFSSMRHFASDLEKKGHKVIYIKQSKNSIIENLENILKEKKIDHLSYMLPADRSPRDKLVNLATKLNIQTTVHPNMLHITSEEEFEQWYKSTKRPVMENFYRLRRKQLNILMDGNKPVGGEFNYDKENRKSFPKEGINIPSLPKFELDQITKDVIKDVDNNFKDNPGSAENIWFATNHEQADAVLKDFVENRLINFGPFEDAIKTGEPFLFHSTLSPYLNNGLLEVNQVIEKVLSQKRIPIQSLEGFIRQVIGWREYMYGLYHQMPELESANYFNFKKDLEPWWFTLNKENYQVNDALDNSLKVLEKYSYNHHIERLMVFGNWFLINEYNPQRVNDWFMSMYIDAYPWVMYPNVVGMSQYADGGKVATKPYISGDAYLNKMGRFKVPESKDLSYTEKYWKFLKNNREKLKNNSRITLALRQALLRK